MTEFLIKKLPYDLTSTAGLALVGRYLKRIILNALVDPQFPVRAGISNSDTFNRPLKYSPISPRFLC